MGTCDAELVLKNLDLRCAAIAAYIFKLQVTNSSFDRRTFCGNTFSIEQILSYFHCVFYVNVIYISMYNIYKAHYSQFKVIEKCTNFYFGIEKLPPKF